MVRAEVVPKSFDSEDQLLKVILRDQSIPGLSESLLIPNGDDAAVLKVGDMLLAVSIDSFVEGTHFDFEYFSPQQAGAKAIEATLSDIVAVGARAQFVLINLALGSVRDATFLSAVYDGVYQRLGAHKVLLIGGNVSSGTEKLALTVTALGEIPKQGRAISRGGAKPGDRLFVSGMLGSSHAGLRALQQKLPGHQTAKSAHLEPRCRADIIELISPVATALIDVSDGLVSELSRIAAASVCDLVVVSELLPLADDTLEIASKSGESALSYALCGGEDYELVFTVGAHLETESLVASGLHEIGYVRACSGAQSTLQVETGGELLALEDFLRSLGQNRTSGFDHLSRD